MSLGSLQDLSSKRKEVFKPILDNPFTKSSDWPLLEKDVSEHIMGSLVQLLSRYGQHLELKKKNLKTPVPEDAEHIHMGFNSVVQALERQAAPNRARVLRKKAVPMPEKYVKYVFVTKADVSTKLLTDLFPTLAFSASKSLADRVKLIELPKGASGRLLKVLHTEHVNFFALAHEWKSAKFLFEYIDEKVPNVEMPWLEGIFDGSVALDSTYKSPNIKFVKTSVPVGKKRKGNQKKHADTKRQKLSMAELNSTETQ